MIARATEHEIELVSNDFWWLNYVDWVILLFIRRLFGMHTKINKKKSLLLRSDFFSFWSFRMIIELTSMYSNVFEYEAWQHRLDKLVATTAAAATMKKCASHAFARFKLRKKKWKTATHEREKERNGTGRGKNQERWRDFNGIYS